MHLLNVAAVFVLLVLVGVEFSVSVFVHPCAWRLDPEPQLRMLSRFAAVMGKVMPVWYAAALVLLGAETWLHRHAPGFWLLVVASGIWLLTTLATILLLVPLNNRVIEGAPGWQAIHHTWDARHRMRIVAVAVAACLLTYVVVH